MRTNAIIFKSKTMPATLQEITFDKNIINMAGPRLNESLVIIIRSTLIFNAYAKHFSV